MFKEIPASKISLAQRKLIFGVGTNDACYITQPIINGKQSICPFYRRWKDMLARCYREKLQEKYPTYKGCTVCDEWLTFSNFKAWMVKQDWKGKYLDKDLLFQDNKLYSPDNCILVTSQINVLLTDHKAARGLYPQGVSLHKPNNKCRAQCNVDGKRKYIGYFDTPSEAFEAYKSFKYNLIRKLALEQPEPLKSALLNYKIEG